MLSSKWHLWLHCIGEDLCDGVTFMKCCCLFDRFNYRSTHYMSEHGYYNFLNWFDDRAWYPLGRIVGGTVRHLTAQDTVEAVHATCSVNDN